MNCLNVFYSDHARLHIVQEYGGPTHAGRLGDTWMPANRTCSCATTVSVCKSTRGARCVTSAARKPVHPTAELRLHWL